MSILVSVGRSSISCLVGFSSNNCTVTCTIGGTSSVVSCSDVPAFITSRMSPNASGEKGPYFGVKLWASIRGR